MKPTTPSALRTTFSVLSLLYLFTLSLFAQADPLRVAVMPSFTQNQAYGNAETGKPVAVWGRAWGGTPPYTYTLNRGDGSSESGAVANPNFIGGDHTYTSSGGKAMTLTVTDSAGATASRSATVRAFLNPEQDIRVNIAIERGLLWLYRNHSRTGDRVVWNLSNGSYNRNEFQLGTAGFATLAFEENGHKLGNDYEEDIYAEMVQGAINHILAASSGRTTHGSSNFYDHSDGLELRDMDYLNNNGYGAYLWAGGHATYVNGICGLALALATDNEIEAQNTIITGGAFNGLSHFEVMQDLAEQFSFAMTDGGDNVRGGWIYNITTASSGGRDGSSQQWPCLFLRGASDLHGIEAADWVKDGINISFTGLQNSNGAVGYRSSSQWLNSGKAGGAMVGWSVAGKDSSYAPVQSAIGYIGSQYYQAGGWNPPTGWSGYCYSMYGVKKGLALMEIETIATGQGPRNWYSDMASWLLGENPDTTHANINSGRRNTNYMFGQHPDGHWTGSETYDSYLGAHYTTANSILILTRAVTVPLPVAVIDGFTDPDSPDPEDDGSSDLFDEVKAGQNVNVSASGSFHQAAPDFVINQYQWILREDDGAGSPVGALDWNSPDYTGVNIVLDRDPGDIGSDGLLPGVYHLSLRVRDDADPAQFSTTTEVFEAVNKNFPPIAVPIPAGQIAYTGEYVPGNAVQVTLDGTQSYDPEGDVIVSYAWDLDGDGEFNDPEDQALADDATSPTPTLTFAASANIEVGLEVCSIDEFGDIKCSSNQARVEVYVTDLDLSVASISASNIVQGVSADLAIEFASDLTAPLSGVQVQIYDNVPPIYGGGGVALGGVLTVDFVDDGSGNYTASLSVVGLALNALTEEVYVFIDSNTAIPEYNESLASNVAVVNVSNQPPIALAKDVFLAVGEDCTASAEASAFDNGSSDPDGDPIVLSINPAGPWEPGVYEITLSVTDGQETATDTATLTVVDTTAPVIVLNGGDLTLECSVDDYVEAGASVTDNCDPDVQVVIGGDVVDVTAGGTYTVTYNATDVYGNGATQVTRTVIVQDTTAPGVVSSPADEVIECPEVPEFGLPQFTDACDADLDVTSNDESLPVTGKEVSKTRRTWTATDDAGLSISTSQTITVVDTTAPIIATEAVDQIVECDGAGNVDQLQAWLASNAGAVATDACSEVTWTHNFTGLSDDCGGTGSALVTFTGTDAHGNTVSTSATFSIIDTTAPDLGFERDGVEIAETITIKPNEVPVMIDAIASDICGDVTTVIQVECYKINGAGKLIDKSDSCEYTIVGSQVRITDSGGVGTNIKLTAVTEDECGNTSTEVLVIEVINPGNGGGSTANEGLGNGVDGDTPGHDNNGGNDDPGNSPGNPGAKKKNK